MRGVRVASLTHAAGLSSTGDPSIDAALPLPEAYEIPESTIDALGRARRVIAIGTSVVRALEGAAVRNRLWPGRGITRLTIDAGYRPRIVDGVVSGIHAAGESHRRLLAAFGGDVVGRATDAALADGFREHEHGDAILVLPNA
jgi:S-adenosylmethionine:tRNA ribosyltransferase-isomerase